VTISGGKVKNQEQPLAGLGGAIKHVGCYGRRGESTGCDAKLEKVLSCAPTREWQQQPRRRSQAANRESAPLDDCQTITPSEPDWRLRCINSSIHRIATLVAFTGDAHASFCWRVR